MKAVQPPRPALHPGSRGTSTTDGQEAAGCVSIGGAFAREHLAEIIDLARRFEQHENLAHSGKRIIATRNEGHTFFIDTNDVRLARAIGEALCDTYQGELKFHFGEADWLVRVHWQR